MYLFILLFFLTGPFLQGMDEEAIAWFEKARALDPSDASVDHHQGKKKKSFN